MTLRTRLIPAVNGLDVSILEAGFEETGRPCVVLLHGFPEIAYSWRNVIPSLASAGYHVVAPDQRGYGATTGWDGNYDGNLEAFSFENLVADIVALVDKLGHPGVACVVGHDFGSPVAGWCALTRPDVFHSVVMMSAPFAAPRSSRSNSSTGREDFKAALAALDPPRTHYHDYYSSRTADRDMRHSPQGLHAFLRAYFHVKSGDWTGNSPTPLRSAAPEEFARLPRYYVMDLGRDMASTAAEHMPSEAQIASCAWLPDDELEVYVRAYAKTGFQGGLQWYRCRTEGVGRAHAARFADTTIDVPAMFIGGRQDWGVYQTPGALEGMKATCSDLRGVNIIDGAGHWVQQERAAEVASLLRSFLETTRTGAHEVL